MSEISGGYDDKEGKAVLRMNPEDVFPAPNETPEGYFVRMSMTGALLSKAIHDGIASSGSTGNEGLRVTSDVAESRRRKVARSIADELIGGGLGGASIPPAISSAKKEAVAKPKYSVGVEHKDSFVLDGAKDIVYGARQHLYGHASINFRRVADLWTVNFGTQVSSLQVGLAMVGMKLSRLLNLVEREKNGGPLATFDEVEDGFKDIAGYAEATMRALYENPDGSRNT
jgi:hypothetical protein